MKITNAVEKIINKETKDKEIDLDKYSEIMADLTGDEYVELINKLSELGYTVSSKEEDEEDEEADALINSNDIKSIISRFPLLTNEQELDLANKKLKGDLDAKELLINSNLRLVVSIVKKYLNRGVEFPDLFSAGCTGLTMAVDKFDPSKGYKLSTFATWWIRQQITSEISTMGRMIRIPVNTAQKVNEVKKAKRALEIDLNREPSLEEVAERLGITEEKVIELLSYDIQPISYDQAISSDSDDTLLDFISTELVDEDETSDIIKALDEIELKKEVRTLMRTLTPREKQVILLRKGFINNKVYKLQEIGEILGVTKQMVKSIEEKATHKMKIESVVIQMSEN